MKIRNIVFSGFMASILMAGGAYAATDYAGSLTTKTYVDTAYKANATAISEHTGDTDIHVTAEQKTAWTNKQNALNTDQLAAVNSGITAAKLQADEAAIAQNADDIATLNGAATEEGSVAYQIAAAIEEVTGDGDDSLATRVTTLENASYITKDVDELTNYTNTLGMNSAIAGAVSEEETRAKGVEEGLDSRLTTAEGNITALDRDKADKADTYSAGEIDSKLSEKVDVESGKGLVETTKVTAYDAHLADSSIHVTTVDKTKWDGYATGKQDALSEAQLAAADSGITSTLVGQITTNGTAISTINNGTVMKSGIDATKVAQIATNTSDITSLGTTKQDVIDDLDTIRSGAGAGATAVQPSDLKPLATSVCGGDLCYVDDSGSLVEIDTISVFDSSALE